MALVLNDRVKETTTTTGTGTINLGGAATGFETFVAGIGNSNTTYYCIAGQGTAEFEVGIGTVTDASPDTLSRTTILSSSNSDSAVNFSAGTKDVFCTLPASKTIREVDTALNVPTGTTAQRAGSPAAGDLRFNTTTSKFEGYSGSAWGDIGVGNFLVTNTFTGDGSDTTFTISNAVADENNLLVFIDGVFQAQNVYSISGTTLTFATAPANGRVITVYSALNNIQGANVVKATMTGDNSDTTLALGVTPISENAVQVYFDGVYQNKDSFSISGETLTFGVAPPTGVAVEAITLTVTDLAAAASSILVDEFTGDGSDTTFTLSAAPANENNTQVFVGGVYQEKATYSISGTTLTFSEAPANTVSIEVVSVAVGQINSAIQLSDADGDTKVMVEESADEDTIRMDIAGTEVLTLTNSAMTLKGTTPTLTIGDAGAEDTKIVFDGNAQDYYIGLDDSADDLIIGKGSTVGTTPAIIIDENLKVGIGTAPGTILHTRTSDATSNNNAGGGFYHISSATAGTRRASLFLDADNGNFSTSSDGAYAYIEKHGDGGILNIINQDSADTAFQQGGSERMRITSSGKVGIGTTSPSRPLEVTGSATDFSGEIKVNNSSSASGAHGAIQFVTEGESTGLIIGKHSSGFSEADLSFVYNELNSAMQFGTNNTERMRIDSTGRLLIGTTDTGVVGGLYVKTASQNDNVGVARFQTDGSDLSSCAFSAAKTANNSTTSNVFVRFGINLYNAGSGQINANGSGQCAFGSFSDRRLKENITDLPSQLEKIKALRPREFDYIEEEGGGHQEGFIAQEIEEVYPDLVGERADGMKTLATLGRWEARLIKAIQELSAKVEELEGKIE